MSCDHLHSLSDAELISSWRTGNPDALAILYLRYGGRLSAFVRRAAPELSPDDQKDIAQETWKRVAEWTSIASHGDFFHALCTIAKCRVINEWDRVKVRRKYERELSLIGLQGASLCRYCGRTAKSGDLCDAHQARKRNGATEAGMAKPIQKQRRRGRRGTSRKRTKPPATGPAIPAQSVESTLSPSSTDRGSVNGVDGKHAEGTFIVYDGEGD